MNFWSWRICRKKCNILSAQRTESNEIYFFSAACTSKKILLRLVSVRAERVHAPGCMTQRNDFISLELEKRKTNGKQEENQSGSSQNGQPKRQRTPCGGAGTAHHPDLGDQLYALRHERHHQPSHPGDRRLQAQPPEAAVHHVPDEAPGGQAYQERQRGGRRP